MRKFQHVGTKVIDTRSIFKISPILEKISNKNWKFTSQSSNMEIDESEIGEGKRFQVIEDSICRNCGKIITEPHRLDKSGNCKTEEPKNWRITAFTQKNDDSKAIICKLQSNGNFRTEYTESTLGMLSYLDYYEIYSVEVLQNNEWVEYKIGDKIQSGSNTNIIEKFDIWTEMYGILRVWNKNKNFWTVGGGSTGFSHVKPLFQLPDENGKMIDIYQEDPFYYIGHNSIDFEDKVFVHHVRKDVLGVNSEHCFATEKAAQQYIDMNKKIFSKQEVLDVIENIDKTFWNVSNSAIRALKDKFHLP